jgi:hypothetical protein
MDVAAANTRFAIENAVYLTLLATADDPDMILDALEPQSFKAWEAVMSDAEDSTELARVLGRLISALPLPELNPQDGWIRRFEQSCKRLEGGSTIYACYRMLSSAIHTGMISAVPYLLSSVLAPDEPLPLVPDTSQFEFVLTWALHSCIWSGWAIDQILKADLFGGAMAPIANRLDLPQLVLLEK